MNLFSYLKRKPAFVDEEDLLDKIARGGPHEGPISEAFEGRVRFDGDAPVFQRRLVVLAFTNRSGSNLMAEYMRQAGRVAGVGEFLNHDIVAQRVAAKGLISFPDYIRDLNESLRPTADHALGLKASWDQLAMLLRWNITGMFPHVTVIHVIRHFVVEQSVSYGIALRTKAWTSNHKALESEIDVATQEVSHHAMDIHRANLIIRLLSESFGLQRLDIGYEQMINNPKESVSRVLRVAGLAAPSWTPRKPSLTKQSDARNRALTDSFYEQIRKRVMD